MKRLKMALMAVVLVGLVLGVQAAGWAGPTYLADPVTFFVIDDEDYQGTNNVTLTIQNFLGHTIYYSIGDTGSYQLYTNSFTVPTNSSGYERVTLKLDNSLTVGTISFMGTPETVHGFPTYSTINVMWNSGSTFEISVAATSGVRDGFSNVPIPASVLLLGAGLLGVVRFRRRGAHK